MPTPQDENRSASDSPHRIEDFFGEVISAYSRAQAIEDGVLVDVSDLARETGFRVPVAVTAALWADIEDIPADSGQDTTGRLWDLLASAHFQMRRAVAEGKADSDRFLFGFVLHRTGCPMRYEVKSIIGPGDRGEPVLTLMKPGED